MAWTDDDLLDGINYLYPYNSWWLSPGVRNPKADAITNHILNLKHPRNKPGRNPLNFDRAVDVFTKRLIAAINRLDDSQLPDLAVIIPSCEAGKYSEGMAAVVSAACEARYIQFDSECLTRTKNVPKKSNGGSRSIDENLKSIKVNKNSFARGSRILLIDDVTTSGNSMNACKQILQKAGAGDVIMLALACTLSEDV